MKRATIMLRKKLKSEEGASLMLALVFFVICAMVGSVVLAAASGAAGRIAGLRQSDQTKYKLESAAGLLKASITDWSDEEADGEAGSTGKLPDLFGMCEELSRVRWTAKDRSGNPVTYPLPGGGEAPVNEQYGTNPGAVTGALEKRQANTSLSSAYKNRALLVIDADSEAANAKDGPILAKLELMPDYTLYVDLRPASSRQADGFYTEQDMDETQPSLMMTFPAQFTETLDIVLSGGRQVEESHVSVRWSAPVVLLNETRAASGGDV